MGPELKTSNPNEILAELFSLKNGLMPYMADKDNRYPDLTFVGLDFVNWLQLNVRDVTSDTAAVDFGQQLLETGKIQSLSNCTRFFTTLNIF